MAQTQLAQLAVETLDLEKTDAHEHVYEGAGLDEHIGSPGLPGHGLGKQGLPCPGRAPQEDAARDVATLFLDFVRLLEESNVFPDQVEDVVLAPDVVEARRDLLGEDHIRAAPGQEPEDPDELDGHEEEAKGELEDEGEGLSEQTWRRDQCLQWPVDLGHEIVDEQGEYEQVDEPADESTHPEPGPWLHMSVGPPLDAAKEAVLPERVVGNGSLGQPVVDLPDQLQQEEDSQRHPCRGREENSGGLPEADESDILATGDDGADDDGEEDEDLDAIPRVGTAPGGANIPLPGVQALLFTSHESTTPSIAS